jgi:hypothetical protein
MTDAQPRDLLKSGPITDEAAGRPGRAVAPDHTPSLASWVGLCLFGRPAPAPAPAPHQCTLVHQVGGGADTTELQLYSGFTAKNQRPIHWDSSIAVRCRSPGARTPQPTIPLV